LTHWLRLNHVVLKKMVTKFPINVKNLQLHEKKERQAAKSNNGRFFRQTAKPSKTTVCESNKFV
jgi:hypothetical protein